jgi:FSR family fosmidomycin resistance protein-like MFS transporter
VRERLAPLAVLMAIAVTRGAVTTSISTFWPLLHRESVAALFGSSAVIAVMMLAGGLGNVWGGRISDRVPHHVLLAVTGVAASVSLAAFALVHGPWIYPFAALAGLFGMSGFAVTTVMGQNLIPERVAMASGLVFGLANALTSGTVALLSLAAAAWGGSTALLLVAAICLCGLPAALAYPAVLDGHRRRVALAEATAAAT